MLKKEVFKSIEFFVNDFSDYLLGPQRCKFDRNVFGNDEKTMLTHITALQVH